MPLLESLPLDKLTPSRLWSELDVETRTLAAQALYQHDWEDGDARVEANRAIATTLRFRELAVRKLPVGKRVHYLARAVRPAESLACSLLLALHMEHRKELLTTFLDSLEIPHRDGIIHEDHEVGHFGAERLGVAVGAVSGQFPAGHVDIYLASLIAMDPQIWGELARVQPE